MRVAQRSPGPWWVALPALAAAAAGLLVPRATSTTSAAAAVLAVGALALVAGHTWGLMVVLAAHTALVGRLWPALVHVGPGSQGPGGDLGALAISVVLVTALPTIALTAMLLPRVAQLLLPERSVRAQGLFIAVVAGLLAATLILPALPAG